MLRFLVFSLLIANSYCFAYDAKSVDDSVTPDKVDSEVSGHVKIDPENLEAGTAWKNDRGHGAAVEVKQHRSGTTDVKVSGQATLINKDQDRLTARGSHSSVLDSKLDTMDRSSKLGLEYSHRSKDDKLTIDAQAGATFIPGMKPSPSFEVGVTYKWRK